MPRYFFDVQDGKSFPDYDGCELPDLDAARIEAVRLLGGMLRDEAETFWGGYSGVFVDPDGHPWEVAHNPGWAIADDGSISLGD